MGRTLEAYGPDYVLSEAISGEVINELKIQSMLLCIQIVRLSLD